MVPRICSAGTIYAREHHSTNVEKIRELSTAIETPFELSGPANGLSASPVSRYTLGGVFDSANTRFGMKHWILYSLAGFGALGMLIFFRRVGMNVLIAIDILGNTLTGGSRWHTISARTGYYAYVHETRKRWWWTKLACIIDVTFWPWQGWDHCKEAQLKESAELFNNHYHDGNDIGTVLVAIPIIAGCIPILILGWLFRFCGMRPSKNAAGF